MLVALDLRLMVARYLIGGGRERERGREAGQSDRIY
jgi:hypothetical protein